MKDPDISVIICTCNRADRLAGLFKDLESQIIGEPRFPWEIVLVDNNSTDRTRELVEKCRGEGRLDIRYVFEKRQGKCFALNTGIDSARGELLAFTDDDVKLDKYWISALHEASLGYPHGCFGGRVLPMGDIPLPPWLTDKDAKYRIYGGALVKHDHGVEPEEYGPLSNPPIGANMFVRKQIFEKHGYFNTKLGYLSSEVNIGSEDSEIMHRFRSAGEAILYYPKALVHHPVPVDRINKAYFRKWWWVTDEARPAGSTFPGTASVT